ncbi:MAG: 4Fe-4S dicluster domain-containing protein [Leptospiraceae bacterium]|nr:4Fe-4S dicluster domain-containing protein [Leptospiraceae bacterium]MCB1314751.1 4Fe-4S dicluster domain-containing protein [Leptospiraceae bacterium]MCB1320229.1 4Fe-4S dicluster domain-containing protein [Leptospiraceae bacterium]
MARYAMAIDMEKCVACNACVIACKDENNVPDGHAREWTVQKVEGVFPNLTMENYSERCHHCANPPCVYCCPTGASHVEPGGFVKVTPQDCIGCKACIAACPYDARYVHPDGYVDKCTFCDHRVKEGKDPACVEICPTFCLTFGDTDDQSSEISQLLKKRNYKRLKEDAGTDPRLYFLYGKTGRKR